MSITFTYRQKVDFGYCTKTVNFPTPGHTYLQQVAYNSNLLQVTLVVCSLSSLRASLLINFTSFVFISSQPFFNHVILIHHWNLVSYYKKMIIRTL